MIIEGMTIVSRPDSGSEDNIISADVLSSLGLEMDTAQEHQKVYRVASGSLVRVLGRVMINNCTFASDSTLQLCCIFYVFKTLICPLLMGMSFLDETETLIKYRHRLQHRTVAQSGPMQLSSLNNPRRRLYCLANSQPKLANADTGSEINLLSLAYIRERDFVRNPVGLSSSTVQFADGSTAELSGRVDVLIVLGNSEGPRIPTTFYVLDGLTCDILFGEDFLEETVAFRTYRDAFSMIECDDDIAEVNGIVWFNTMEQRLDALTLHPEARHRAEHVEGNVNLNDCLFRLPNVTVNSRG